MQKWKKTNTHRRDMAEIDLRDMFERGGREERVMWMDAFGVQPSMLFPVETDEEVSKAA